MDESNASPQPQPHSPTPFQPERVRRVLEPGCARPVAIGCGGVLLLATLAVTYLWAHASFVESFLLAMTRFSIVQRLPADFPAADRARFDAAFETLIKRAREGQGDPTIASRLQTKMMEMLGWASSRKMTAEEAAQLLGLLEELARAGGAMPSAATPGAPPEASAPPPAEPPPASP